MSSAGGRGQTHWAQISEGQVSKDGVNPRQTQQGIQARATSKIVVLVSQGIPLTRMDENLKIYPRRLHEKLEQNEGP